MINCFVRNLRNIFYYSESIYLGLRISKPLIEAVPNIETTEINEMLWRVGELYNQKGRKTKSWRWNIACIEMAQTGRKHTSYAMKQEHIRLNVVTDLDKSSNQSTRWDRLRNLYKSKWFKLDYKKLTFIRSSAKVTVNTSEIPVTSLCIRREFQIQIAHRRDLLIFIVFLQRKGE